ncbi:MAG: YeeE/YedE family protein [Chloroflexota bacterium]
MILTIVLAIVAGVGLGYILERGDFCFHSTLRGLVSTPRNLTLVHAYLLSLLIAVPLVQGLIALGVIEPWVAPWAWQANIAGGVLFGVGMVVAATCVTGLFYKLGHGMLGTIVGLAAWSIGDLLAYRGFLSPLRNSLNRNPINVDGGAATILNTLGSAVGVVLLVVVGGLTAVYLYRLPQEKRDKLWSWPLLGLATGLFTSLAWLLVRLGGYNYTYGTSGVPTGIWVALTEGSNGGNPWIPIALISLIPGAFLAAYFSKTLWVRGETGKRYTELAIGGLLMGIGAGISGGCNLGHSLVGVPLLSLGSITTTLSMLAGVFLADRAFRL